MIVCTSAVVVGLCGSVVPNRAAGKTVRAVLGLYMALLLVSPFARGEIQLWDLEIELPAQDTEALGDRADALVCDTVAAELSNTLSASLASELGLRPLSVEASVHIDEQGGIYCSKVVIELDRQNQESEEKARALVEQLAAAPAEFRYG